MEKASTIQQKHGFFKLNYKNEPWFKNTYHYNSRYGMAFFLDAVAYYFFYTFQKFKISTAGKNQFSKILKIISIEP